ncbi:MAG: carnitine dehydratase [Robiginitomaculum sp.]|nr:MAG: carnitine dehydratase [Robiginitomaculum sp.]
MENRTNPSGPLCGVKILEFAGLGPVPFCGMLLADLGADIVRIDRPGTPDGGPADITSRGRRSITLDLKSAEGQKTAMALAARADILLEGFRPGVMEKLNLGPDALLAANPALVYGRMTGWGQDGPLAQAAGHDLNYVAITGALAAMGAADQPPAPPLNLVGDYGGGSLYLAFGVMAALHHAQKTGQGQVVDCAIVDGVISMMAPIHWLRQSGMWNEKKRQANILDGGAFYYGSYACSDGNFFTIGAIEPQFYALLRDKLGLKGEEWDNPFDQACWPDLRKKLAAIFAKETRSHWQDLLEGTDVCAGAVMDMVEAADHPHNKARQNLIDVDGILQPAPAPRFSKTPGAIAGPPPAPGADTDVVLKDWGIER